MVCAALPDTYNTFEIYFRSEMCTVKQITCEVIQFLKDNIPSLSEEDTFDLKLIYSELLVNAVIHGNKMDRSKSVYLFVETMDNTVYSVISDEGLGFDYTRVMTGIHSNNNLLKETGRGICLACSLTEILSFARPGNRVEFYKQVGRKEDSSLMIEESDEDYNYSEFFDSYIIS